jgi:hypothetical protein
LEQSLPSVRLIKVNRNRHEIVFTVIAASALPLEASEALSVAAAEIAADFDGCTVKEEVSVNAGPLPQEDILANGWVYLRAE